MHRRYGIGYTGEVIGWPVPQAYATPVSAISFRWWSDGRIGVEADAGFAVSFGNGTGGAFSALGKVPIRLVKEENVFVYVAPGLNLAVGGDSVGLGLGGVAGVELFFQSLPRIGFGAEVGLGFGLAIPTHKGGTTTGAFGLGGAYDLTSVGVRYYFE